MRKAKIVCTIGPASQSRKILSELIRSGMDAIADSALRAARDTGAKAIVVFTQLRLHSQPPLQA
jgi:pyruvate kinase